MKATLEFDLPEEHPDHILAVNGFRFALALEEFDNLLRGWNKYGTRKFESPEDAIDAARDALRDCMADRCVSLDMIT